MSSRNRPTDAEISDVCNKTTSAGRALPSDLSRVYSPTIGSGMGSAKTPVLQIKSFKSATCSSQCIKRWRGPLFKAS